MKENDTRWKLISLEGKNTENDTWALKIKMYVLFVISLKRLSLKTICLKPKKKTIVKGI